MSVSLLKKEMDRLYMNVIDVNLEFADDILLETLLTNQVEKPACCLTLQALDISGSPVYPGFWYNREGVY